MIARRSFIPLWISLALAVPVGAPAVTVEQIPNPRPAGWVVDLTGTLPFETVADLNRLGGEVQARTGADLVVAVIPTTEGVDPRDFATRLFNAWNLGSGQHNSILVFAALDDRAAEIVLGDSLNTEAGLRESQAIMQGEMVPRFREGNPAGAIWSGAQACAQRLLAVVPSPPEPAVETFSPPAPTPVPVPVTPPQAIYEPESDPSGNQGDFPAILFPLAVLGTVGLGFWFLVKPPKCPRCQEKMAKLDEEADDAYLESSEKVEEQVGSVDHQIWVCPACGERTKRRSLRFASGYKECPGCSARTLRSTSFTLSEATYDHGGQVQVDETCANANCSYSRSYTYATARLERRRYDDDDDTYRRSSSASSSSSWSSSSFSSDSSPSSSSSSSGSSSGGDHSSGGGASGRW